MSSLSGLQREKRQSVKDVAHIYIYRKLKKRQSRQNFCDRCWNEIREKLLTTPYIHRFERYFIEITIFGWNNFPVQKSLSLYAWISMLFIFALAQFLFFIISLLIMWMIYVIFMKLWHLQDKCKVNWVYTDKMIKTLLYKQRVVQFKRRSQDTKIRKKDDLPSLERACSL